MNWGIGGQTYFPLVAFPLMRRQLCHTPTLYFSMWPWPKMYQKCSSAPGWTLLDSNGNQIKTEMSLTVKFAQGRGGGGGITWELDMLTRSFKFIYRNIRHFEPHYQWYHRISEQTVGGRCCDNGGRRKSPNITPWRMCLRAVDEKDVSLPLGLSVFVVAWEGRVGGSTKGDRLWSIFYTSDISHQPSVSSSALSKWIFLNPWCSPNHRARSTSEGLFSILSSLTLWRLLLNHYVYTMYSPTSNFVFEQRVGRVLKCLGRRCGEVCPIINFFPFYAFPKCFRF